MFRKNHLIIALCTLLFLLGCENKTWDDHYYDQPETVDQDIWEVIQADENFSIFAGFIKEFKYDSLFEGTNPYTMFIPTNEAWNQYLDTGAMARAILDYHISLHVIQSRNIRGREKIQTLGEKFAWFERSGSDMTLDEIPIEFESPLYRNGKYYIIKEVALPKPNLYEFFALNNPILKEYIDSQDSIILDKELSRPIGFDEDGNTIYDTVSIIYNEFEEDFFPVSEEFRFKTATIVFPLEDDYNSALTEMAQSMGSVYEDYTDIPLDWQNDILIPYLLEHGVFENMVEESEFILPPYRDTLKMKNILGDSVVIDYQPSDKYLCSNGYAYNYDSFEVPDTLWKGSYRHEGEWLLRRTGSNKFTWLKGVTVTSTTTFPPLRELVPTASNDSIMKVNFNKGYTGSFTLDFNIRTLFPRKYLMVIRTHMYVGGIYDIYVNDELVMTMDWYDYVRNREVWFSAAGGVYRPESGYNRFDCFIENKLEYGQTRIKFVYKEPGRVQNNGLVIDYLEFVPVEQ
jgi:uncharacterized surface protein with fasciclin (FAS1) repeats